DEQRHLKGRHLSGVTLPVSFEREIELGKVWAELSRHHRRFRWRNRFLDRLRARVPNFSQPATACCLLRIIISSDADELGSLADSIRAELDGHLREILVTGDLIGAINPKQAVNFAGAAVVKDRLCAGHRNKAAAAANKFGVLDARAMGRNYH